MRNGVTHFSTFFVNVYANIPCSVFVFPNQTLGPCVSFILRSHGNTQTKHGCKDPQKLTHSQFWSHFGLLRMWSKIWVHLWGPTSGPIWRISGTSRTWGIRCAIWNAPQNHRKRLEVCWQCLILNQLLVPNVVQLMGQSLVYPTHRHQVYTPRTGHAVVNEVSVLRVPV